MRVDATVGEMSFGGLAIRFDSRVLRPRPWTVAQSAWAGDLLRTVPPGPVLELCAGVGHIGLLAVEGQSRSLVMVDASEAACEHAAVNSVRAGAPTDIRCGRMDEVLGSDERFPMIIADPPWVPSADTARFPEDPLTAIDGGDDGLDLARTCLDLIGRHLHDEGEAVLQIGNLSQLATVEDHLVDHSGLALRVLEYRTFGANGVLVRLGRTS